MNNEALSLRNVRAPFITETEDVLFRNAQGHSPQINV